MVQRRRVKEKTFDKIIHDADMEYREFERTLCVLHNHYGVDTVVNTLSEMAGLINIESVYLIEDDAIEEYPVVANRKQIVDFFRAMGRYCSPELFDDVCSECICKLNSNTCWCMRHYMCETVMIGIRLKGELLK